MLGGVDGPLPPKLRRWAIKQQRSLDALRNRQNPSAAAGGPRKKKRIFSPTQLATLCDLGISLRGGESDATHVLKTPHAFKRNVSPADGFCPWRHLREVMETPSSTRPRRRSHGSHATPAMLRKFISRVADLHEAGGISGSAFRTTAEMKARAAALRIESQRKAPTATCWAESAEIRLAVETTKEAVCVFHASGHFGPKGRWIIFTPVGNLNL